MILTGHVHHIEDTTQYASCLAEYCCQHMAAAGGLFFFSGPLGAGKTTFIQYFLAHLGVDAPIKSPTFSLLHVYETEQWRILHADCYRFQHPQEWSMLGIDHYESDPKPIICCVEWPERTDLKEPTATITLDYGVIEQERLIQIETTCTNIAPYFRQMT